MTHSKILRGAVISIYSLIFLISCSKNKEEKSVSQATELVALQSEAEITTTFEANSVAEIGTNIISAFQDKKGNYWFGTQSQGLFYFNGKTVLQFTEKDGLSDNQIQTIQEDVQGNLWLGTGRFRATKFDGRTFTTYPTKESLQQNSANNQWKITDADLWFSAANGPYRYDGASFVNLPFPEFSSKGEPQNASAQLNPYSVYCTLKDSKGNVWFGTQSMGVCRYDGNSFTWFKEKGLAGPAVLAIFEDRSGNIWFGNNGYGVFRLDNISGQLTNFTNDKGLANPEFRVSGKIGPGTLSRIYAINEDSSGNLWIGTTDAGAWRYDGNTLVNYTTKNGLASNAVTSIYKDKSGELWFGTETDLCKFDGTSFTKFLVK